MQVMLQDFISTHQSEIIERSRLRVFERGCPKSVEIKLAHGVPLFLKQLVEAFVAHSSEDASDSVRAGQNIADSAALHGKDLLTSGYTVAQVVHGYGDVCQVVTELIAELGAAIPAADFQIFNRCLDEAIAGAVTAYGSQRELEIVYRGTERLGVLGHELRNLISTATLSFEAIKLGAVGIKGSTGGIHTRSLSALHALVERSLAEVRLEAGVPLFERVSVGEFMDELKLGATMQAEGHGIELTVSTDESDGELAIDADRQLLASAISNLLQNAFKFTRPQGRVTLRTHGTSSRVVIEIEDECGGLPPGKAEQWFRPFTRGSKDHRGLGLGLSIALSAARANAGELNVRDLPGQGCIFTLDLPRQVPAVLAPH